MSPKKPQCSCIVPFYNEGERVFGVLDSLLNVKNLHEVFCVDDGSTDSTTRTEIKKRFPKVILLVHEKNKGKSAAVKTALAKVSTEYVMLMDADLQHVVSKEIEAGINDIVTDKSVGMIIFRRLTDPWFSKAVRGETLTSGERILKTEDLKNVLESHTEGYQLEYAINTYMMKHNKMTYWVPYSAINTTKVAKMGFVSGISHELIMYKHMMEYSGSIDPLKSFFFFCKKKYQNQN